MEREYLTLEEKMDLIIERMFQAISDDYDDKFTEEEIDQQLEEDVYFDNIREEKLEVEGYEDVTFNELCGMSNERILEVYNIIYGESETIETVESAKLFWDGCSARLEK